MYIWYSDTSIKAYCSVAVIFWLVLQQCPVNLQTSNYAEESPVKIQHVALKNYAEYCREIELRKRKHLTLRQYNILPLKSYSRWPPDWKSTKSGHNSYTMPNKVMKFRCACYDNLSLVKKSKSTMIKTTEKPILRSSTIEPTTTPKTIDTEQISTTTGRSAGTKQKQCPDIATCRRLEWLLMLV